MGATQPQLLLSLVLIAIWREERAVASPDLLGTCTTDMDCHLNGNCTAGWCQCRPAWSAVANCSVLAVLPAPGLAEAYQGFGSNVSAWGGSVAYDPTDGLYHMFVAEMVNHCGLETWHPNSQIVHATSPTPSGPFTKVQVVMHHYAHGPSVARDPISGTWILTHLGSGVPDETSRPINGVAGDTIKYCKHGNSYNTTNSSRPGHRVDKSPPTVAHRCARLTVPVSSAYMLFASSPYGPWSNGTKMPNPGGNAVPIFFDNGSLVIARQGTSKSGPTDCAKGVPGGCTNGSGFVNWQYASSIAALKGGNFSSASESNITVAPWTHWEDVFLWVDEAGYWHCLFHAVLEQWEIKGRLAGKYSHAQPGGHAYSKEYVLDHR